MAYATDQLALAVSPKRPLPWVYVYLNTDADSNATLTGASFFSDGYTMGMRVGDLVDAVNVGTALHKRYQVASVSGTAATVATPTAIT